jgi:UDP-glucose:(heptosyl)LPS alpha-1,3-glucosyltransferase
MKKIAIVCRNLMGYGGTTTTVYQHATQLRKLGWDVHLYADRLDPQRVKNAGATPHRICLIPIIRRFNRQLFATSFEKKLTGMGFDVVHGHGDVYHQDILSLHNCVHLTHEIINGTEAPDKGVFRLHHRQLSAPTFRLLIANSNLMKTDLVKRFSIPPEKIKVIYPGYDPAKFNANDQPLMRQQYRQKLSAKPDDILVGMITSGDFKKRGVINFLKMIRALHEDSKKKMRAVIVGKESHNKPYQSFIKENRLAPFITFLPSIPNIEYVYHALDIFVYPAHLEEFGQSVQEAFVCGLPVIASKRVGAMELLDPDVYGSLEETPDPGKLAARLHQFIQNPDLRHVWSEMGIKNYTGNTWQKNFEETLKTYQIAL